MSVVTGKSALAAVSESVIDVLSTDSYLALCPGGAWEDLPADPVYPVTWFSVNEVPSNTFGRFGKELELRVHVFSQSDGLREAHLIMALAIDLLNAASPAVTGFSFQYLNHLGTVPLPFFLVGGRSTKHVESRFMVIVEETE